MCEEESYFVFRGSYLFEVYDMLWSIFDWGPVADSRNNKWDEDLCDCNFNTYAGIFDNDFSGLCSTEAYVSTRKLSETILKAVEIFLSFLDQHEKLSGLKWLKLLSPAISQLHPGWGQLRAKEGKKVSFKASLVRHFMSLWCISSSAQSRCTMAQRAGEPCLKAEITEDCKHGVEIRRLATITNKQSIWILSVSALLFSRSLFPILYEL